MPAQVKSLLANFIIAIVLLPILKPLSVIEYKHTNLKNQ